MNYKESFQCDWFGEQLPFEVNYSLSFTEKSFILSVKVSSHSPTDYEGSICSSFTSGLWRRDVAEIFFRSPNEDRYYELHLSPSGAWWAAEFSAYRKLQAELSELAVRTESHVMANSWEGTLTVRRDDFPPLADVESLKIHLAGIISGDRKRWFFSSGEKLKGDPDFHHKDLFQSLLLA